MSHPENLSRPLTLREEKILKAIENKKKVIEGIIFRGLITLIDRSIGVEDVMQIVTMKALLKANSENAKELESLVVIITLTSIVDLFRKQKIRQRRIGTPIAEEELEEIIPTNNSVEAIVLEEELSDVLSAAFLTLSPRHQLVLFLRFFMGLNLEETAAEMELKVGGVKALQHRAVEKLRNAAEALGLNPSSAF